MKYWYRIEVDDKDGTYDLEAILDIGIEACNLSPEDFEIVGIEVEDAD